VREKEERWKRKNEAIKKENSKPEHSGFFDYNAYDQ
jgi:hypothetical protein